MDADTTKGKGAHERSLAAFESLPSGVLLGTQMIAKGLDYPEVTLVGVISADVTLNLPDFRAGERTYQLLEQVAGRAGRGERRGRVVIQTYWPEHTAILAAAAHDSALFYAPEAVLRASMGYPPYRPAGQRHRARPLAKRSRRTCSGRRVRTHGLSFRAVGTSLDRVHAPLDVSRAFGDGTCSSRRLRMRSSLRPLAETLAKISTPRDVTIGVDVDPVDLL